MSRNKLLIVVLLVTLAITGLFFATCNMPMGMGDPIDFEPPILTLDPVPTPLYVKGDTKLTGKVSDNIGVYEIILRDTTVSSGDEPIARAVMSNERTIITESKWETVYDWEMELKFDSSRNGEKLSLEIVAFDFVGNSGDTSIKNITIIIDVNPPITEDMTIQRSDTRTAFFEPFAALDKLRNDQFAKDRVANVNRFQNGFFNVLGTVSEQETRILDDMTLNIYDAGDSEKINMPLLKLRRTTDSSSFSPKWLVSESEILEEGEKLWPGYTADFTAGKDYIYRVAIEAYDRSLNEAITIIEEEGFFILSFTADIPKGNLDPIVGTTITKGGTIPVEFFDDDTLLWAYTGLLTDKQWRGETEIAPGVKILDGTSHDPEYADFNVKLEWLQTRLLAGNTVYNWRYCRHGDNSEPVTELIKGGTLDEKIIYLQTGNTEQDYGQFVLFTLVADKKLDPHTNNGPRDTNKSRSHGRHYTIDVIDENAPLIVLDVEDGCPEENTFPSLTDGEFFTIRGYTLRENGNQLNGVITLRMAWIPSGKAGGADSYIPAVQAALRADNYPASFTGDNNLAGVQYWNFNFSDFTPGGDNLNINYNSNDNEEIGKSFYRRQPFERTFSVLGNVIPHAKNPGTNPAWKDFHFNCAAGGCVLDSNGNPVCRENENKLFVIFAECNMGHQVYRQMRLLGNRTPPSLSVYDISGYILDPQIESLSGNRIPNLQDPLYGGIVTPAYDAALKTYNERTDVYDLLRSVSISNSSGDFLRSEEDKAIPFQMYTWGTILKYWVRATPNGDLGVKEIRMRDITLDGDPKVIGSHYKPADNSLTFIEYYPDEAQRVFLLEAEDSLGNVARMQRTVAVTNAARLEKITTETLSGSYGIGTQIILQADFSGLIQVNGSLRPQLNIRFPINGGGYEYRSLPAFIDTNIDPNNNFFNIQTLFLKFLFTVPENASGPLETMFGYDGAGGVNMGGNDNQARPIFLPSGTSIIDVNREQNAFIPGYINNNVGMPNWITAKGSLQANKAIILDGVRPVITGVSIRGGGSKTAYSTSPTTDYYFKSGETIELVITADKDILNSDIPHLTYTVSNIANSQNFTPDPNHFVYQKQGLSSKELIFSLPVSSINDDGQIRAISIYTGQSQGQPVGRITDKVGNELLHTTNLMNLVTGTNIYIKKTLPQMPVVTLANTNPSLNVALQSADAAYPHGFTMTVSGSAAQSGFNAWEDVIQYSKDGGLSWSTYTATVTADNFPNGTYNLRARYRDRAGNEGYQRHRCSTNTNNNDCLNVRNYSCAGTVQINANFPILNAVTAVQSTGWFTANAGQNNLTFNLAFEERVQVATTGNTTVTMTLRNRNTTQSDTGMIQLTAATGQTTLRSSIQFNWTGITGKEMPDGLYVSEVVLTGLRDSFGNSGGSGTATFTSGTANAINMTGTTPTHACTNLAAGYRVDAVNPTVNNRTPAVQAVSANNTSITLEFSEPVMRGSGTITIRPRGNFAIPPVFEDEGYWLDTDGTTRYYTPGANRTYIKSLFDVYNEPSLTATERNYLTEGTTAASQIIDTNTATAPSSVLDNTNPSMSRLRLNTRTGQAVGPYIKTTHGLTTGVGYTGNYNDTTPGANGPSPSGSFMVPDTTTKWVLDYTYLIHDTTGAVSNIRAVLNKTKFRWQEIDVLATGLSPDNRTVTITLNEPLLKGLQWDVYVPAGAFTDMAGNPSARIGTFNTDGTTSGTTDYWFWSSGVQEPVIRVNRRTFDARTAGWHRRNANATEAANGGYSSPGNTTGWSASTVVSDTNGWGITDFNLIHYRVESESPGATIQVGTLQGSTNSATAAGRNSNGAAIASFTVADPVLTANTGATQINNVNWNAAASNTAGQWVLSNIIRRSRNDANVSYTVTTKAGTSEQRQFATNAAFRGFRSYNRDATKAEIDGVTKTAVTLTNGSYQSALTFGAMEANKSYISATATLAGQTAATGYEGIFRTVIAFYYSTNQNASNYIAIEGSNIKNGMPSIAGFPVRDAEETGDNRFIKIFHNVTDRTTYYWVSTEIVCEWYFLSWGGGNRSGGNGTHQNVGEVNNYQTVGYGDLTYGYNITRYN